MTQSALQSTDALTLWCLCDPEQPGPIGTLQLLHTGTRGVSLRYAPSWLESGFALSEDLPLIDVEYLPRERGTAPGAVDDARPDRWGERVIRFVERPPRLSLIELLYFAGDQRFGALGVSRSAHHYEGHAQGPLPNLSDVQQVEALICKVLAGEPVPETQRRLIAPGATMGGARPKALIEIDGAPWVLKFGDEMDSSEPLVEHAAMTLAAVAGITVAETRPITLSRGCAVAVKRFDRKPGGARVHALSAHVALRAAGVEWSYSELAQLLRRRGDTAGDFNRTQMRELFRRMVFNILIDNTDDHEKNHVLLMNDAQQYELSPAFDVLPAGNALGYQSMIVGTDGAVSSVDNALSMARTYWLNDEEAAAEVRRVVQVVNTWRRHFDDCGVPARVIDRYAMQIDRAELLRQRRAFD